MRAKNHPKSKIPTPDEIEKLALDLEDNNAQEVISWAIATHGSRIGIATSLQAESMVVIDMAVRIDSNVKVFTVDTGRLPQQTYDLIDKVREQYGIQISVYFPDSDEISQMVNKHGINPFYRSVSLRLLCCSVRKVNPISHALKMEGIDAWVTGLRRTQVETRAQTPKLQIDPSHTGLTKINPLADWSYDQVWEYINANDVPYNLLYDEGYTSIGCAPCTRATESGESDRAGRWWWEKGMPKECGIHVGPAWGRTI